MTLADGQCLFVLLEYRSTGVAKQLIDAGIVEADKRGLECFLEGTMFSTPGLLRVGFIVVDWTNLVFPRRDPSKDWKRLVNELQSHPISIMWRPKMGRYIEGKTVLPWSGKTREAKL
jgi:GNAT superfamily N-acetyltransferase